MKRSHRETTIEADTVRATLADAGADIDGHATSREAVVAMEHKKPKQDQNHGPEVHDQNADSTDGTIPTSCQVGPTVIFKSDCHTSWLEKMDLQQHGDLLTKCVSDTANTLLIQPEIKLYGKTVRQPRDVGFYSDTEKSYRYSNQTMKAQPLTLALSSLLQLVNQLCHTTFKAILVNRYNTGCHNIGAHSDDETGLEMCVATVSVGATRLFRVREKRTKARVFDVPLESESLICMRGGFQSMYTHEIPKQLRIKDVRVSFTFRYHS
jgi:alkylated DNA repair dioxygenase AlkB